MDSPRRADEGLVVSVGKVLVLTCALTVFAAAVVLSVVGPGAAERIDTMPDGSPVYIHPVVEVSGG